ELEKMIKNDREKYETFYESFGRQLKFGVYSDFGANKDVLQDLLMFKSSHEDKLVTLEEYVSRMPEDQKHIYYAVGESIERIKKLPQTEAVLDKGYEILFFTEDIDEFAIKMLMTYSEKDFKSVSSADLDLDTDQADEEATKEFASIFENMATSLKGKVKSVRASRRLKTHPVCLANEGELSIEMEKVLNAMPNAQQVKADKVLEVNVNHEVFKSLQTAYEQDRKKFDLYTDVLYNQALLIEGLSIEDPVAFTNNVCQLMK
ncbi:molecular chaperone HtpG, partial [Turicibacter sanguinis]|nr:molecular chaperone HtpG [Turicibacter sanguinis]